MVTREMIVEAFYNGIKLSATSGALKSKDLESLAELVTELANRLKVEEDCGE